MPPNSPSVDPKAPDRSSSQSRATHKFWRRRRILFIATIGLLIGPYVFSRVMSPFRAVRTYSVDVANTVIDPPANSKVIRVCCFNIAHGRGLAVENTKGGTRVERNQRLTDIGQLLKQIDADIVVLNEVDFDSTWSYGVNQAEFLAETAGYRFVAEQRNLDFRIATATWRFGNAVLSRHPITAAKLVDLPALKTWEAILAGKKKSLLCQIEVREQAVQVGAIHFSHRSETLRVTSARQILGQTDKGIGPTILAGDFNSTPSKFPGGVRSTKGENTMHVFSESARFHRRPQSLPTENELTFRSDDPKRTIDWILASGNCSFIKYEAIDVKLSDHRPVVADIEVP